MFYGYQKNASELAEMDKHTPFSLGLPLVDFSLNIHEVIMNNHNNPIASEDKVIYRQQNLWDS